jgi:hypothetical protein
VILWRLRGVTDREVVCEIEKHRGGYRLLVKRGEEVMVEEAHDSVKSAKAKALTFKNTLLQQGWSVDS